MDVMEAITKRRSIRQYNADRPIDDETVNMILEAAIAAPSAGNGQSWHFEVVRDASIKHKLATEAGHQHFLEQAPVTIVVCTDLERAEKGYGLRGRNTYSLQETAAAIQNMLLVVTSLGLGACWVGAFDEGCAAEILDLPKNFRPIAMIPIGEPAEPANRVPVRKKISDVVTFK
ncbi:MAG: nitroreductase family protein [Deltaproteobacteria bacterium]|jgi:nitroreductase|nr:nitroreductase family protein [Deltaproteobacteria bacterium]